MLRLEKPPVRGAVSQFAVAHETASAVRRGAQPDRGLAGRWAVQDGLDRGSRILLLR